MWEPRGETYKSSERFEKILNIHSVLKEGVKEIICW